MDRNRQYHTIAPVYDERSRLLILGSFPSVKSRETAFFYGHPQNRFWRVLASVLGESVPQTVEEKKAMLLRRGVALWDVIASCEIEGSSDASIAEVEPNDLGKILNGAKVRRIFCNGGTALRYYKKYCQARWGAAELLPSTSPANARMTLEGLCGAWTAALAPWLEEER